jgi:thiol-disulfide isomerase/thioredoxin
MKQLILIFFFCTSAFGQNSVEQRVLQAVQEMMRAEGKVTFSKLYNSPELSPEEREFLGHLYETAFAIPAFLRDQYRASQRIPSTTQIADHFGISRQSVLLLLGVLESDSRVPNLYDRDPGRGEITTLHLERIEQFLRKKGGEVRITKWEGMDLPDFRLQTLRGSQLTRDQISGQSALIYFWFTGCPPCVKIAPILAELSRKYPSSQIGFYGFNADDLLEIGTTNDSRLKYLRKQGIRFVNANLDSVTREAFGNIKVYPTLFLVDKQGKIVRHLVNLQTRATLVEAIEQTLE